MDILSKLKSMRETLDLAISELEKRSVSQSGPRVRDTSLFRENGTHLSDSGLQVLRKHFDSGMSIQATAKQIGLSEQSVWRYFRKFKTATAADPRS